VDTDDDGLFDGDEVRGLNYTQNGIIYTIYTDPLKWDTDDDSITWPDQYGEMSQPLSDGDEWALGTDPTRRDTDLDGIQDGWELWLGRGLIPGMDAIPLDPLSNDTDGDLLIDGKELVIANMTTLLNPYIGYYLYSPFNTSAVNADSDGDFIDDRMELEVYATNPSSIDSDNDTLSDYDELEIYHTNPIKNDTDGDGLTDYEELNGFNYPNDSSSSELITTDPNNSDSDGDLLPDGAEVFLYNMDPRNPDMNSNEILDGMDIDSDNDGLYDGEEYYIYGTIESSEGGGPFEPDSDRDGLFDGMEVYELRTDPADWDTDDDTYSDTLEYLCGANPLDNTTTSSEMNACFAELERIVILSPVSKTYSTNAIPVIAFDSTSEVNTMTYRFSLTDTQEWSERHPMYEEVDQPGYWKGAYLSLPLQNGTYELEVTAIKNDGSTVIRVVEFTLDLNVDRLDIISPESKDYFFAINPKLPIEVQAGLIYNGVWFRMKFSNGTLLSGNHTLEYDTAMNSHYLAEYEFPNIQGKVNYTIEVFASKTNGEVVVTSVNFSIRIPTTVQTVAAVVGTVAVTAGAVAAQRAGKFKNPFRKSSTDTSTGSDSTGDTGNSASQDQGGD
ncbi:MAG: hypothetical protein OEY49_06030, partial [Candidatus Heimdallarchaeota archaeon]|nr:hypothetical protein [Candidatus Heimdallarchaeota archaeon]